MGFKFDYDAPSVPDTAVADVACAIKNQGKLPPLTNEDIERRKIDAEIYQLECQLRGEERRAESERKLAQAAAVAEQERRIALEQDQRKARRERQEQIARETRERELRSLQMQAAKTDWWQRAVDHAARNALVQRQRQALVADLENMINPPPPAPEPSEPQIIYVEENKDPSKLDWPVVNRWFER